MNDFKGMAEEFRLIVEEIECLEIKRNMLRDKIKDIYHTAKSHAHDISLIKSIDSNPSYPSSIGD